MTTTYSELREAIAHDRAGKEHWRCSEPLRERVVTFARQRQQAGEAVMRIAEQLGLSPSGLSRWLPPGEAKLRPVRIAEKPAPALSQSLLVLVTPSGYRLEGLDADSAVDVLRRLAC